MNFNATHSHKRSLFANEKETGRRHRTNRYNYETISPANMKIRSIKKLLREKHIKLHHHSYGSFNTLHRCQLSSQMIINVHMNNYYCEICLSDSFFSLFVYFVSFLFSPLHFSVCGKISNLISISYVDE